jgi:hypothetical protein
LAIEKERIFVDSSRPAPSRLPRLRFEIVVRMEASWASMSSLDMVLLYTTMYELGTMFLALGLLTKAFNVGIVTVLSAWELRGRGPANAPKGARERRPVRRVENLGAILTGFQRMSEI